MSSFYPRICGIARHRTCTARPLTNHLAAEKPQFARFAPNCAVKNGKSNPYPVIPLPPPFPKACHPHLCPPPPPKRRAAAQLLRLVLRPNAAPRRRVRQQRRHVILRERRYAVRPEGLGMSWCSLNQPLAPFKGKPTNNWGNNWWLQALIINTLRMKNPDGIKVTRTINFNI